MILPKYESYQDSGVGSLGLVPSHWTICAAKRVIASEAGGTLIKSECPSEFSPHLFPAFSAAGQDVWIETPSHHGPGIVLSAVGARCGKTFKADGSWGVVANTHCLFARGDADRDYLWYLTNNETWWDRGGTAQPFIKVSETLSRRWAFPPAQEQIAIARFLDREVDKVNAVIAQQERLTSLLSVKLSLTIADAVLRGLDPESPTIHSGITWLGQMPSHWTSMRVKRVVASIEQGWSPQCDNHPVNSPDEWGVLKVGCVNGGQFQPAENKLLPANLEPIPRYSLKKDDLLISRANTRDLVGSAAVVQTNFEKLLLCDKLYRLRLVKELCLPSFLAAYLATPQARSQFELDATGASNSMLNIGQSVVLELPVSIPPLSEQREILNFIEAESRKLESLRAQVRRTVLLLKERRDALITAAVTGQIDVRGTAQEPVSEEKLIA